MRSRIGIGAAIALVAVAAVLGLWARPSGHHQASPSVAGARTVLVADAGVALPATPFYGTRDCLTNATTCVNGAGGIIVAYAVATPPPTQSSTATVLTDENCAPDRYGVSHCLNRLRLATGRVFTVRHDHNMHNDPCLSPGERVVIRPAI